MNKPTPTTLTYPKLLEDEYQSLIKSRNNSHGKTSGAGRTELKTLYEELNAIWSQNPTVRLQRQLAQLSNELSRNEQLLMDDSSSEQNQLSNRYESALKTKWQHVAWRKQQLKQRREKLIAMKLTLRQNMLKKRDELAELKKQYDSGQTPELEKLRQKLATLSEQLATTKTEEERTKERYKTLTSEQAKRTNEQLTSTKQRIQQLEGNTIRQNQQQEELDEQLAKQLQTNSDLESELQSLENRSRELQHLELKPLERKLTALKEKKETEQKALEKERREKLNALNTRLNKQLMAETLASFPPNLLHLKDCWQDGRLSAIAKIKEDLTSEHGKLSARLNRLLGNLGIDVNNFLRQFDKHKALQKQENI